MAEDDDASNTGSAKTWLKLLGDADEREYHKIVDNIDDIYADLRKLAASRTDREYKLFWANLGVLLPTLYSRAPVPVATSRFRDRKELARRAADILERVLIADVDVDKLHDTMLLVRDDLGIGGRGVPWLRLVERNGFEVPCARVVHRRDYRCERARYWHEVSWVAKQAWLTRKEVLKRFKTTKGFVFQEDKPERRDETKGPAKASIWEIWDKTSRKVIFVSEGVKDVIETVDPPIDFEDFFPCPRPAMGTVQRGTLTAVPDFVYYKDQLEEINELTARIGGLQKALRLKGFYPAGNDGLGAAVEKVFANVGNEAYMVPVSSWALVGGSKASDAVMWLPIVDVATALTACVELRRQHIEDVYEITGISDIMRGATDARETKGAQELKAQFGSVRIRERQEELVRVARDVIRMKAEVYAENVPIEDLLTMAQVDDLPTAEAIQQQAAQITQQAEQQIMQVIQQAMQAQQQQPMPPQGAPPPQGMPM